jgi:hypothetical protein
MRRGRVSPTAELTAAHVTGTAAHVTGTAATHVTGTAATHVTTTAAMLGQRNRGPEVSQRTGSNKNVPEVKTAKEARHKTTLLAVSSPKLRGSRGLVKEKCNAFCCRLHQ